MRFSYLFYDPIPELDDLDRRMAILSSLGYQGIELSAFYPLPYRMEEVASLAEKHALPVVSFLTGWSYPNERLCLSSPDPAIRDRAVARLGDYVGQASEVGALLVMGLMQGLRSDEPDEGAAKDRIAESLRRVARVAEDAGVSIVVEPVNHLQVGFHNSAAEVAALVGRVGSPAVGYMLDTFHVNIEERSMEEAIRIHGPAIRHVHLCETTGGLLGTGHLDVPGVLSALGEAGYDRFVSVKVYRGAGWEEAARDSMEHLRRSGFARS